MRVRRTVRIRTSQNVDNALIQDNTELSIIGLGIPHQTCAYNEFKIAREMR